MDKCVIIAAMPVDDTLIKQIVTPASFIITADAGWVQAEKWGIPVQMALGDFDSSKKPPAHFCSRIIQIPVEKDDTDTHFAVKKAIEMGFTSIDILGGLGGRLSHTLANLATQLYASKHKVSLRLVNENVVIYCLAPGTIQLQKQKIKTISIFPAEETVQGVTLQGLKYALKNEKLCSSYPVGCSNSFVQDKCKVSHTKGYLRIVLENIN